MINDPRIVAKMRNMNVYLMVVLFSILLIDNKLMERDLYVMMLFLIVTQEILNKYKNNIRLTVQEKILFFVFLARTIESWERLHATLPAGDSQDKGFIKDGSIRSVPDTL